MKMLLGYSFAVMIEVQNVHKIYPGKIAGDAVHAVNDVSFRCEPGRIFALLGPNGSGKTTLLRMIATMMKPTSGSVKVAGKDILTDSGVIRKQLGFLTGSAGLHHKLSASETLDFFGKLHGIKSRDLAQRKEELIERFQLSEFLTRATGTLSMGQKQRVMLARTLIHDPEIVVFDEATTGLDVLAAKGLIDIIRACRNEGKTVLFSTHIMGEVSMLADDVFILHEGREVYSGTMDKLRSEQSCGSLEDEFVRLLENAKPAPEEVAV